MDWNKNNLKLLELSVAERWEKFRESRKTDRKNLSELWNAHIRVLGITVLRQEIMKNGHSRPLNSQDLIDVVNFRNKEVSDALCVRNPDRFGQYIFIPREIAEKIMVLGMP